MKHLSFILFLIVTISILSFSIKAQKVSKKNAKYTGKAIVEYQTMYNAGTWFGIINKCEGTFAKKYKQRLGSLSWEDFKNFNAGNAKYAGNNWQVTKCDKNENAGVIKWYNELISYIENQLNIDNKIEPDQITETKNDKKKQKNNSVKEKLKELKSMFEEKLITQKEYDAKRKEILDSM